MRTTQLVKEMTNMYHTQTLNNFIDALIRENKKWDADGYHLLIDDLSNADLEDFAAHLIEDDSTRKGGWEFLFSDLYREELASTFASYILSYGDEKEELKDALLDGLKKSAIKVYRELMQKLIDNRLDIVFHEDEHERKYPSDADDWDYQERAFL